jgi:hypothetical protein
MLQTPNAFCCRLARDLGAIRQLALAGDRDAMVTAEAAPAR